MLDLGFEKILIIGIVGVIILGPERLPKVAKGLGIIWARFQHFSQQIKQEVNQLNEFAQSSVDELAHIRSDVKRQVNGINLQDVQSGFSAQANAPFKQWSSTSAKAMPLPAQNLNLSGDDFPALTEEDLAHALGRIQAHTAYKNHVFKNQNGTYNWRNKMMITPVWYQKKQQKKRRLEGSAARMQRYALFKAHTPLKSSIF